MRERVARRLIVAAAALLAAGCAPKMTIQQALVREAFQVCQAQGPATKLERVDADGRFAVVGPEREAQRVHECMVRFDETERSGQRATPPAASRPPASPTPAARPLLAGRLPGTWRGTLTLPPRAAGQSEVAGPATVRFSVVGGGLRWALSASGPGPTVAADGSAVVVDNELRMSGSVRSSRSAPGARAVSVRYAGTMVGDRLEVTGVTGDQQVHLISVRRVAE